MIELRAGCRLHFGLMELNEGCPNRFAGLGVMLDRPAIVLRIKESAAAQSDFEISLDAVSREEYQQRVGTWLAQMDRSYHVSILQAYPFHCGLGAGTQLACLLACAAELLKQGGSQPRCLGSDFEIRSDLNPPANSIQPVALNGDWRPVRHYLPQLDATSLAKISGRGLRSAIGLQGFLNGGLVLDYGYSESMTDIRLVSTEYRTIPETWRWLLIRSHDSSAITGPLETRLIGRMAVRPNPKRVEMLELAGLALDAASAGLFTNFAEAMQAYLHLAGDMFAPVQGGRYNGSACTQAVELALNHGLLAVGQSSWGPTIFGLADSEQHAQQIAAAIRDSSAKWHVEVAKPSSVGAEVRQVF